MAGPQPAVTLPGVYDLIVESENIANPTLKWRNTYTFASNAAPVFGAGITAAIGSFAQKMIHSDAQNVSYTCYNWARGRQPYPQGTPVFSATAAAVGTADTDWPHLIVPYAPNSGVVALRVDHEPYQGGKPGRSFFRALLGEDDVHAVSGGSWQLTASIANLQGDLDAIVTNSTLHNFLVPNATNQTLCVVRYSPKTQTVHGYSGIVKLLIIDATNNKQTRKNKK